MLNIKTFFDVNSKKISFLIKNFTNQSLFTLKNFFSQRKSIKKISLSSQNHIYSREISESLLKVKLREGLIFCSKKIEKEFD